MKKFFRLLCAIVGCLCMLMNTVLASSTSEIGNRLAQISQLKEYKPGASTFGANGCWVFVDSVSRLLYGINIPNLPNGYVLEGAKGYWSCVDYAYNSTATNEGVAKVLKKAQAGDIIQYRCDWAKWQHTAMIYSNNGNTVTLYDFANFKVLKRDVALNNLPGTMGNFGGITGYGITLYRCNHDISTVPIKVSESNGNSGGGQGISIIATTKGADTITETSAILRGEVSSSGGKITECGMYIGTSKNNLTLLGSDKVLSTYGTPCYYSTSKYGYSLQPGTTYYYQVYAVAGGKTVKGETKSFSTVGIAPTPTPTLTPTPTPPATKYQAKIDASENLKAKNKYCSTVVDERTGKVLEFSAVAYYDDSGKVSATLKPGTVVTVDPNKAILGKNEEDLLLYVESDFGNGYVWDAYLSVNSGSSKPSGEVTSPTATSPAPETAQSTTKPYQAYINTSQVAKPSYYSVDKSTGWKMKIIAYNGDWSDYKLLDSDASVTVDPSKTKILKATGDTFVYVTSNSGSGYVWDAYISTGMEKPKQAPPKAPELYLSARTVSKGGTVIVSWEMEPGVDYEMHYTDPKNNKKIGSIFVSTSSAIINAQSPFVLYDLYPGEHKIDVTASNQYGKAESVEVSFTVK